MKIKTTEKSFFIKLALTLTLSLTSYWLFGQRTLSGQVISGIDLKGLSNATVIVKNSTEGVITDEEGYFELKELPAQPCVFEIFAYGYDAQIITIDLTLNSLKGLNISLATTYSFNEYKALEDIDNKDVKLLLVGSIAPVANTPSDRRFEKKFHLKYYNFGCSPPAYACIEEYNKVIFKYLTSKYGAKWLKNVRQDVMYLEGAF